MATPTVWIIEIKEEGEWIPDTNWILGDIKACSSREHARGWCQTLREINPEGKFRAAKYQRMT